MARATPPGPWTVDDFLAWEREQEERYEFLDGLIRMMVGGTVDHNTIASNVLTVLRSRLRGGPCRAFMEGVKVASGAASMYPDVVVTCTPPDPKSDLLPEPVVVIEILSRSTQTFDRGQKWLAYQGIPSLRQYVLISQDELRIDTYDRQKNAWIYQALTGPEPRLALAVGKIELTMAEIYEDSSLDPRATQDQALKRG
jgi:Uma2 family endonuclease